MGNISKSKALTFQRHSQLGFCGLWIKFTLGVNLNIVVVRHYCVFDGEPSQDAHQCTMTKFSLKYSNFVIHILILNCQSRCTCLVYWVRSHQSAHNVLYTNLSHLKLWLDSVFIYNHMTSMQAWLSQSVFFLVCFHENIFWPGPMNQILVSALALIWSIWIHISLLFWALKWHVYVFCWQHEAIRARSVWRG